MVQDADLQVCEEEVQAGPQSRHLWGEAVSVDTGLEGCRRVAPQKHVSVLEQFRERKHGYDDAKEFALVDALLAVGSEAVEP